MYGLAKATFNLYHPEVTRLTQTLQQALAHLYLFLINNASTKA